MGYAHKVAVAVVRSDVAFIADVTDEQVATDEARLVLALDVGGTAIPLDENCLVTAISAVIFVPAPVADADVLLAHLYDVDVGSVVVGGTASLHDVVAVARAVLGLGVLLLLAEA